MGRNDRSGELLAVQLPDRAEKIILTLQWAPVTGANGYRLYRTGVLKGVKLQTSRYDSESEILVRLGRRGARIASVPITTVYGDEVSTINPFVDTGRFFRLVFRLMFQGD